MTKKTNIVGDESSIQAWRDRLLPEDKAEAAASRAAGQPYPDEREPLTPMDVQSPGDVLLTEEELRLAGQIQNDMALADQALLQASDLYMAMGRMQGLEFVRKVSEVALAQTFILARQNKAYKGLPFKDANGNVRHAESFEDFCRNGLGKSYNRCQELAQTYHVLGKDLYEHAEAIGLKNKDYRALKALPAEDQEAVKAALADDASREQVLDLLQEMAARHKSRQEASDKEIAELKADATAKDELIRAKTERADGLAVELSKLKNLPPNEAWKLRIEREAEAVQALDEAHITALSGMKEFLTRAASIIETEGITMHTQGHAEALVIEVFQHLTDWAAEYVPGARLDVQVNPIWDRGAAEGELREGAAR